MALMLPKQVQLGPEQPSAANRGTFEAGVWDILPDSTGSIDVSLWYWSAASHYDW